MIELAQHIEVLLHENDCVIVPGLGGFVAHHSSATHIKEENVFLPPTRSIGFNPQLRLNDGVLVQSYMAARNTSFTDACRIVEKEVDELITLLHEDGNVHLDNIGEIRLNIYGNYEFVPYDDKITTPSLYGLDSFEMRTLSVLHQKEKLLVPAHLEEEEKHYEIRINLTSFRNVVATIAAIILFFAFSTPVENTSVQKNNYAQLMPGEFFEQLDKGYKIKTSKPIAVKEMKVSKQSTAAPVPTAAAVVAPQKKSNHLFHIIVAGGIGLKDAETMASQLRAKGFAEAKALNTDGKVRVSIYSFDNRNEATKQLLELRKNDTYQNAWLLAK